MRVVNGVANARLSSWLAVVLAAVVVPAAALLMLRDAAAPLAVVQGPVVAVGLMGGAMIAAASAGRWGIGVIVALAAGAGLIQLARVLGMPPLPHPAATAFVVVIASISFAARGALFSRALPRNGWVLAVFVVTGEAAILVTAAYVPPWLLALLPAQWASTAIQTTVTATGTATGTSAGTVISGASSVLLALGGTAATTLLVARLWPRRWPYALMFGAWLGLSALVWYRPGPPPRAGLADLSAPITIGATNSRATDQSAPRVR